MAKEKNQKYIKYLKESREYVLDAGQLCLNFQIGTVYLKVRCTNCDSRIKKRDCRLQVAKMLKYLNAFRNPII